MLQVVECMRGYKIKVWGLVLVTMLTVCSGGIFWMLAHSFPQKLTWMMKESSLQDAQFVLAKVE